MPGVSSAALAGVRGNIARVDLRYAADPYSATARDIVTAARAVPPPAGGHAYVGGVTAQLVDELSSLGHTLPWMALVMCLATFVLLFLAFGSVVLPLKAIVMNVLSLSATFGVIVWIFQEGHLSGLLRFTPTGTIDPSMPILMLAIIFGLSMDYEVFLLSRIRERYDVTGDNAAAVASGLQRTGGLITSLAFLLVIVVGAFSASGITFIKLMGVGMIVALVVDATIVRILLVPATMRLLGRANWWAPGPLRHVYRKYGIREEEAAPPPRWSPPGPDLARAWPRPGAEVLRPGLSAPRGQPAVTARTSGNTPGAPASRSSLAATVMVQPLSIRSSMTSTGPPSEATAPASGPGTRSSRQMAWSRCGLLNCLGPGPFPAYSSEPSNGSRPISAIRSPRLAMSRGRVRLGRVITPAGRCSQSQAARTWTRALTTSSGMGPAAARGPLAAARASPAGRAAAAPSPGQ